MLVLTASLGPVCVSSGGPPFSGRVLIPGNILAYIHVIHMCQKCLIQEVVVTSYHRSRILEISTDSTMFFRDNRNYRF